MHAASVPSGRSLLCKTRAVFHNFEILFDPPPAIGSIHGKYAVLPYNCRGFTRDRETERCPRYRAPFFNTFPTGRAAMMDRWLIITRSAIIMKLIFDFRINSGTKRSIPQSMGITRFNRIHLYQSLSSPIAVLRVYFDRTKNIAIALDNAKYEDN